MKTVLNARDQIPRRAKKAGDPVKRFFSLKRDENGNCIYTERDKINIQEDINSYRDSCSLEHQLLRMKLMPVDQVVSSLHVNNSVSADLSNVPTDLVSYYSMFSELVKKFPDFETRIKTESIDDIIKSYINSFKKNDSAPSGAAEPEVNNNGSNE